MSFAEFVDGVVVVSFVVSFTTDVLLAETVSCVASVPRHLLHKHMSSSSVMGLAVCCHSRYSEKNLSPLSSDSVSAYGNGKLLEHPASAAKEFIQANSE